MDAEDKYVKMLVHEEILSLIKKALKEKSHSKEKECLKEIEILELNDKSLSVSSSPRHLSTPVITPPSTPTNLQSTTSSPDHIQFVVTPLPTPPSQSPTSNVTQQLVENISMVSETNRISTPKSSLCSSSNDDVDSSLYNIQPVSVNNNLSSLSTTQPMISTSIHTPQPSSESRKEPPAGEPSGKHTIE